MKKRIASMLAATVMLLSVIALPASAQTDWLGNSDLTTAKVREIADADTLTESQIAEINNHYSEYEIMQGISKTLIEDYAARINPRLSAYPLLPLAAPPNTSVSIGGCTA